MNGQYYLIKKIGTKYKFYWAPTSPAPEKDFEDWGVAVVDFSWRTDDPRPKHLRAVPLSYNLQPRYQVLRDPKIDGIRDKRWRYTILDGRCDRCIDLDYTHPYYWWESG